MTTSFAYVISSSPQPTSSGGLYLRLFSWCSARMVIFFCLRNWYAEVIEAVLVDLSQKRIYALWKAWKQGKFLETVVHSSDQTCDEPSDFHGVSANLFPPRPHQENPGVLRGTATRARCLHLLGKGQTPLKLGWSSIDLNASSPLPSVSHSRSRHFQDEGAFRRIHS